MLSGLRPPADGWGHGYLKIHPPSPCGWFVGTVFSSSVGVSYKKGKKGIPTATHVVEYKEKETRTKALVGKVAIEFSPKNYGPGEWWLLLEPTQAAGGS